MQWDAAAAAEEAALREVETTRAAEDAAAEAVHDAVGDVCEADAESEAEAAAAAADRAAAVAAAVADIRNGVDSTWSDAVSASAARITDAIAATTAAEAEDAALRGEVLVSLTQVKSSFV